MVQSDRRDITSLQPSHENANIGLLVALTIMAIWAASTIFLVTQSLDEIPTWAIAIAMLWQTFLYTGLFVTAHDAMHGVIYPKNRKINDLVGAIAARTYALFSLKQLAEKHWQHHNHPASDLDPDFHDGKHQNFLAWYWHFSTRYWSWTRLLGLMVIFNLITHFLHIPDANLTLFWIVPSILSSVQLFYFGSYLPHKEPKGGYTNQHRTKTTNLSTFWSFITCYHFGYHQEHHEYPHLPWWKLAQAYKTRKAQ
jgi:beta-carotene/zeaxanthin 4-ketolase